MKTVKAISKRFFPTKKGKLRRYHPGLRHKLAKKSAKQKRQLAHADFVSPTHHSLYSRLIG